MALDLFMASFEKTGGPDWTARHGLTSAGLQTLFDDLSKKGWRQVCLSGYSNGTEARYATIWHKVAGPAWGARHGLTSAQYQTQVNAWVKAGMRPKSLSGFAVGNTERFAAVFEAGGSGDWVARHGLDGAQYQAAFNDFVGKGFRLRGVSTYSTGGEARYMAWWEKSPGPAWVARHGLRESAFRSAHASLAAQGYDLVSGGSCIAGGVDLYAGLWEKRAQASVGNHGMTGGAYQATFDRLVADGFRPVFVAGALAMLPVDVNLRFRIQRQQQSQWCWSAVSNSIRRYYQPAATLTQCTLVNSRRNRTDCCLPGPGADGDRCNKPDDTAGVLDDLGHLQQMQNNSVSFADLRGQMAAGRPAFVRIEWSGGGRHAIVAAGVEDGNFVIVCDPGSSSAADPAQGTTTVVAYDTLRTAYNGSGSWIGTGYTKA
ncbi:papain-like cysteine protease family protein [Sandarakinorhabdus sp. DWP1-3-1]|uniref:papain-like cysteine protease family protein n=1 Tax=Sandarakinorhabdus sp. DWP1-3-1 TaxID=2804627 RepID=UPI003CF90212